jgi:filamentous hemagglutinin
MDVRSPLNQCIALALAGILFLQPIVVTAAELAVDRNAGSNTQLGQAGNGVPIVNIATPNGSGLSHNRFSEYNVGQQGLILNNATGKTQSTQLGGLIVGNPNLRGQAAGTILNEVTGSNRSRLAGYTEIAGQSARVIVANPHGITCNGCGFINTPRATLTTGKPVLHGTRLDRFQVEGGDILVEGEGLNAGNLDQFDLITRSARINAELHARKLNIIAGRNEVKTDSLAVTPLAENRSNRPELAIDSSALGGMYAGAIHLVGTEAGVGVKLAGNLAASGGDIRIDASGRLSLAQATATGDLQVKAGAAELKGDAYAGGRALLETQGDLTLRQNLVAKDAVRLSSGGGLLNQGVVEAGARPGDRQKGRGDIQVRAQDLRNSGSLVADRNLELQVGQSLDNQGGTLSAQGSTRVSADRVDNRQGRMLSHGELAVEARTLDNRQSGLLASGGRLDARLGQLDNRSGEISGGTRIDIRAEAVDNRAGKVLAKQALDLAAEGAVKNQAGILGAGRQLQLKAGALDNSQQGQLASQGDLEVKVVGTLDNRAAGRVSAEGDAKVSAGTLDNRQGGQLTASAALDLSAGQVDNADAGRIASNGTLTASVSGLDQRGGGQLYSGGDLSLDLHGGHLQNSGGLIRSPGQLLLRNLADVTNQGGEISSAHSFDLVARSLDNSDGKLLSEQSLTLRIDEMLANLRGLVAARGLELTAARLDNLSGRIDVREPLLLMVSGELDNQGGEIVATDGRLQVGSLDNRKGGVFGGTRLDIASSGAVNNREGRLASAGGLNLIASSVDNTQGGRVMSSQAMSIAGLELDNRGGTLSSQGKATLSGTFLDNREGGQVLVEEDLQLFFDRIDNSLKGLLSSQGDMRLEAARFINAEGRGYARQGLSLLLSARASDAQGGVLDNSRGSLLTDGGLLLQATALVNQGGVIASADDASVISEGAFDNRGGQLVVDKHLRLTSGSLDNGQAGQIDAKGALSLVTGVLDNQEGGQLTSSGQLDLNAQRVINATGGRIASNGALTASVSSLDQQGGGQLYSGSELSLDLNGGHLQNSGGLIHAPGRLLLKNLSDVSNRDGEISSHTAFALTTRSLDNTSGKLLGAQALSLRIERALNNLKGQIAASALDVQSGALDNSAGLLSGSGDLSLAVTDLARNHGGEISGGGVVRLEAAGLDNQQGEILGDEGLALSFRGALDNRGGTLGTGRDLVLQAAGVDNRQGTLLADGTLSVEVSGLLDNQQQGSLIAKGVLAVGADRLDNRGGTVSGQGRVALQGKYLDNRGGALAANGPLVLRLDRLDNRHQGLITSKTDFVYQGQRLDNQGGRITSAGPLSLEAEEVQNAQGRIASQGDLHARLETLAQQGGELVAQGRLRLEARALDNRQGGLVGSTAALTLEVGDIDNRGGELSSQASVGLVGQRLDNSGGKVLAGERLILAVDRVINQAKGLIFGSHSATLTARQLDNSGGTLASAATLAVTLAAGEDKLDGALLNHQGVISSDGSLEFSAGRIENQRGTVSSADRLVLSSAGQLDNQGGFIVSDGSLHLSSARLDNGQAGEISAQGDARLTTGTFDNSQGGQLIAAGTLELEAGQVDNSGKARIASGGPLSARLSGLDQHDGGELFSKADLSLDLQQGLLNNDNGGLINSPGQLLLRNLGQVSNRGGEISSQQGFTLAAEQLDNQAGKLLSNQSLVLRVARALDNARGTILANGLDLHASSLDSREGLINSPEQLALDVAGHFDNQGGSLVAVGELVLAAAKLDNRAGAIAGRTDVQLKVGTLDQRGGQLVALGALALSGQRLDNSADGLIGATQGLSLDVEEIDNRAGEISSQGGVTLEARKLDNAEGGRLLSGSRLNLVVEHLINRARGLISGTTAIELRGTQLDNEGGRLLSQRSVAISLDDGLTNGQGLISSEGRLDLDVGRLDNQAGSLSSGDAMVIASHAGLRNDSGQLVTDGALSLASASLENRQGVLSAKGPVQIATGTLDNSQGSLTSASTLQLDAGPLINNAGRIGSGQALDASVTRLEQQGGQLFSNAQLRLDLKGGDLDNREGLINTPGRLLLENLGTVGNQGGEISSQQAFTLAARSIDNHSGKLLSAEALTLRIDQALANLKGLIAGSRIDLRAASLDNTGGTLTSRSDTRLHVSDALVNGELGLISAAQALSVETAALDNRGASLLAGSSLELRAQGIDNRDGGLINSQGGLVLRALTLDSSQDGEVSALGAMDLGLSQLTQRQGRLIGSLGLRLDLKGGDLDNRDGLILARGPLSLERLRDLANQGGEISSHQSFDLSLRHLDNTGGKLISSGQLGLAGTTLLNQGGLLSGWQGLGVHGQSLDNRNLGTLSSRDGDLSVSLTGALHNGAEGALASKGHLSVKAASLDNSDRGVISSAGWQSLQIAEAIDNSAGGSIDSGAGLELRTVQLKNAAGRLHAQGPLDLAAHQLDNQGGSLTGSDGVTLNLLGTFGNASGTLASAGPLVLQGVTRVDNQGGQIVSQGLLTLLGGSLDNRSGGTLAANGALLLSTTGAVRNDEDGLIYSRDAGVRIDSANLTNSHGSIQSKADLDIVTGDLANQGGRLLSQDGNLDITAGNLDNRGGTLASLQGWVNARLSGWLNNASDADTAGIVQGRGLVLAASSLSNQGGHLSALAGDAQLTVGHLDNRQGGLFAAGLLRVKGDSLTNAGQMAGQRVDFSLAGALNNQFGILESDSTLNLNVASLDNRGGQLRALGDGGRTLLAVQGLLDNRNGKLESANFDFGLAAGSLLNTGGTLLHIGNGTFDISLPNVANAGGSIVTQGGLTLNADSWTNSSTIQAGRLAVNVGTFHQTASGQLLASRSFTGSGGNWRNDGLIASDGGLTLSLGGAYGGNGRLTSLGELALAAAQLTLPTTGRITGGGDTTLKVGRLLTNHGLVTSAGGLTLDAGQLDNHGTLGSSEKLRLTTPTLLNENGLIFSGDDMVLRVTNLKNRFADIYSLGSLELALDDNNGRVSKFENLSGALESAGDLFIRADSIENRKDSVGSASQLISSAIGVRCTICVGEPHQDTSSHLVWVQKYRSQMGGDSTTASSIHSGRDLFISGGELANTASSISAVRNGQLNLERFRNEGLAFGDYTVRRSFALPWVGSNSDFYSLWIGILNYNAVHDELYGKGTYKSDGQYLPRVHFWDRNYSESSVLINYRYGNAKNDPNAAYLTIGSVGPIDIGDNTMKYFLRAIPAANYKAGGNSLLPGYLQNASFFDVVTTYETADDFSPAVVEVGGRLTINATQDLSNSVIRERQSISNGNNRTRDTRAEGTESVAVVKINAQLPPDLAQKQVNPLSLPGFSIPSGQNGLFRLSSAASTDPEVTAVDQGPQSWSMGGASISLAQREQQVEVSGSRFEVQVGDTLEAGSRELTLGQHQSSGIGGAGVIQVSADGASIGQSLPGRSQGDTVASVAAIVPEEQPDRIDPPGVGTGNGLNVEDIAPSQRTPIDLGESPTAVQSVQVQPQTPVTTQAVARVQELPAAGSEPRPHKYLIETNPALTDLRQFLSSDYMLGLLGYDPDKAQKRLGDGLYEQRLVREAITARTGQRFLAGLHSDEAMFRHLMDNAIASKQSLNLGLGVSLTAAQIAALTHDIVWLEEHEVNGERVLVPVLYLAQAKGRLAPNGALIQGQDVALISGGELVNQGTLRAGNNLAVTAGDIANSGLMQASNRLDLLATDSIRNAQGGIIAGRDISAIALRGDIINERSQDTLTTQGGASLIRDTVMNSAARIEAANDLSLSAGRDLANVGSVMSAGGDASLNAGRDLLIGSATEVDSAEGQGKKSRWSEASITQHGSDLHVRGNLQVEAGRDLSVIASRVEAGGDIAMAAGRDLDIASAANESHYEYHAKRKRKGLDIERDSVRQQGSEIVSGGDLKLTAGHDLSLTASRLEASNDAYLYAGNDLGLLAAEDSDYSLYDKKKKGSFGSRKSKRDEVTDVRNIGSDIIAGGDLILASEGDQRYQKARLEAGADMTLESGGEIVFEAVKDLHQESHEKSGSSLAWQSLKGKGQTDETLRQSQLIAQGEIAIKAVDGLRVDLKEIDQKIVSQTIDVMVKADPGLAWIKELEQRGDVDWQRVREIHDAFSYSHSGLGAGAQLAIAIVMAAVVGPAAGAAVGGGAGGAVTGAVATSAATKGTISIINNRGDLGAALKDVTSKESLKDYAVAGVTAGLTASLFDKLFGTQTNPFTGKVNNLDLSTLEGVGNFAGNQLAQSATAAALNELMGRDASFKEALQNALYDTLAAASFNAVGDYTEGKWVDGSPQKVAVHAIVGGLLSKATGGDFATGAVAAGANEALVVQLDALVGSDPDLLTMASQLVGLVAAAAVDGDIEKGAWVAKNATQYNFLTDHEMQRLARELSGCEAAGSCDQIAQIYFEKNQINEAALESACTGATTAACQAKASEIAEAILKWQKLGYYAELDGKPGEILSAFHQLNISAQSTATAGIALPSASAFIETFGVNPESSAGIAAATAVASLIAGKAKGGMLGQNGVKVSSKTIWKGQGKERVDVENPNPGQRPGQIHYQDNAGNKYLYDPVSNLFVNAPKTVNSLLNDVKFKASIEKGMRKYLGE